MDVLIESLQSPWAIRALIATSLVGITCGMIGCFIVLRNMSMIGDALSHAILPGIFVSYVLVGYSTVGFFTGSVAAGLLTAAAITWIQHNVATKNDAAIGIVFIAMFSIGVIGISWLNNQGGNHLDLKDFLFGTAMGVSNQDIIVTLIITIFTIYSFVLFYRYLFITTFQATIARTMGINTQLVHYFLMLLLSFAVVSAMSTVGVILVIAMLVTPASTALLLSDNLKRVIFISAMLGMLSASLGLILAILLDLPPGPAMVLMATGLYILAVIFAPEKGLIVRSMRQRQQRIKIEREDILKRTMKHAQGLTLQELSKALGLSEGRVRGHLTALQRDGSISSVQPIMLSAKGKNTANKLIRAHRLWETYQVNTMGLSEAQIHDEAERLEHHLTKAMLDKVDQKLGYPQVDPHGSPIPQMATAPERSLLSLRPNAKARIAKQQISDQIESELWELGLMPNTAITVKAIDAESVAIKRGGETIKIDADVARLINVKQ